MTISVPGYISRSVAGSYDNEGIAIFALQFTYFLWVGQQSLEINVVLGSRFKESLHVKVKEKAVEYSLTFLIELNKV